MGIFTRNRPAAVEPGVAHTGVGGPSATSTGTHHTHHHEKHAAGHQRGFGGMPSFGQWLKATGLDILTMAIMGAIGLGVYFADPAPSRSFPVYSNTQIVYPQFAYPLRKEIVPIWAAALLAFFVPLAVFLICQIRVRSFWDLNNAVIGLLYSLIVAAVFQVFLKWLIGGLRPHFLAVCDPDPKAIQGGSGNGFANVMYDRTICRGDKKKINDALESFPSGHSTAAFAGFVFLYLYLNAKLKVFANYHPAMWKLVVVYAPLLGAVLIAGALTIDEFHNWYDCLAGAIIGTMMALSSYRMVYAAIWDFRFNHIPLNRTIGFTYSDGQAEFNGFRDSVWTRKAGFGDLESAMATGAPGDATGGFGGGGAGLGHSGIGHGGHGHSVSRRPVNGAGGIV